MADRPNKGPPPKKDDRRAANTTVHLENKGKWNGQENTTGNQSAKGLSAAERQRAFADAAKIRCYKDLDAWALRHRIPFVSTAPHDMEELLASGAQAWIAINFWSGDEDEFVFAMSHATQIFIAANNIDPLCREVAELVAEGHRVVMLDGPPEGCGVRLPWGTPSEASE
jgi:hypothetical protein